MVRAIWAVAVVCLLAVAGAQPARAGAVEAHRAHPQVVDRHPALPAVAAVRHSSLVVAARSTVAPPLPPAILATPPVLAHRVARAIAVSLHRVDAPGSASVPTRSARGPPAC